MKAKPLSKMHSLLPKMNAACWRKEDYYVLLYFFYDTNFHDHSHVQNTSLNSLLHKASFGPKGVIVIRQVKPGKSVGHFFNHRRLFAGLQGLVELRGDHAYGHGVQ